VQLRDKSRTSSEEEEKIGGVADVSEASLRAEQGQTTTQLPTTVRLSRDTIPPFMPSHDFARGAFVVFQTAITYALMLSLMYVYPSRVSCAAKITQL
jgi:Ctr copper transporter family